MPFPFYTLDFQIISPLLMWVHEIIAQNPPPWQMVQFIIFNLTWNIKNHLYIGECEIKKNHACPRSLCPWLWFSNSSFAIKLKFISHAHAKLIGFKQPIHGLNGQFLLTNIDFTIFFISGWHLWCAIKCWQQKMHFILI